MLSNRIIAAVLVGLMTLSLVPLRAEAQTVSGSDLVATGLSIDDPVVGNTTSVHLTIHNAGNTAISGPFTVFFGWNDTAASSCLQSSTVTQDQQSVTAPCYQQVSALTTVAPNGQAGDTITVSMPWTINQTIAYTAKGSVVIATQIEPGPCTAQGSCPRGGTVTNSNAAPDDITDNNIKSFPKLIKTPGVRAYPLRPAPLDTNSFVNDAWPSDKVITEPCSEDSSAPSTRACKGIPGHTIVSRYHLVNIGNVPDTFTPTVLNSGDSTFDSRGFTVTFAPPTKYLAEGEGADIIATVFVPTDAASGLHWNVGTSPDLTVTWASQINPNIRSDTTSNCTPEFTTPKECLPATLLPFVVGVKHGINISTALKDNFTHVSANNNTDLNIIVKNTGNARDTYAVVVDRTRWSINDSWLKTGAVPGAFSVDPGASVTVAATVNPPPNATRGYYTAAYLVQSTATDAITEAVPVKFSLQMDQFYALNGQIDNPLQLVVPGEPVSYSMSVSNPGNGPENLTVSLANIPPGWTAALSETTLTVGPRGSPTETARFYLNASAPANTPANRLADFFVNVTSNDPIDRPGDRPRAEPLEAKLQVLAGPNAQLTAAVTTQFINPGNETTYNVHITNAGNEAARFDIRAEHSDTLWNAIITPNNVTLNPINSPNGPADADITITLRAPPLGQVGDFDRLTVTVTPATAEGKAKQIVLEGRISGPDLVASAINLNTTNPYSGDPLDISLRIANTGNRVPDQDVVVGLSALQKDGSIVPIGNRTIAASDLRPNAVRDIVIPWDTTGIEGDVVLQASVDPASKILEIDETNNAVSRSITLRVFDIKVEAVVGLDGHPGESISYNSPPNVFQVQYAGNEDREPVTILFTSEHGWISAEQASRSLDLPRGFVTPVRVDVLIPALPGVSTDRLTMKVIPTFRPGSAVSVSTTTTVLDDAKPTISSVTATPTNAVLGANVTIHAKVVDATGLSSVRANVITPSQDIVSLLMSFNATSNDYSATASWNGAGAYGITIAAIDGSPAANTNDTHAVLATFTVTPGSLPVIALASGQSPIVHAGTLVRLSITDPLGIAKANYSYKGVTYDMGTNYTLDTTSFSAGPNDIIVAAENIYHVPATTKITITIDNTPPGIRLVTVNPTAPKAGEDTIIHIETDAKVTSVQILVKKDGQVVDTRDAIKKSSGIFELTLNPDTGDYTLDVTAKDAAGNAKLSSGAATFSAKPDSPFHVPGPSLGLLAVALAAALMLGRHRRRT